MKSMSVSYFNGNEATKSGSRLVHSESIESELRRIYGEDTYYSRASSAEVGKLIAQEVTSGRTRWAQLSIEIDEIFLAFWLPLELEIYCEVFTTKPFPTARTLLNGTPDSTELNSHWLSRLPKKAKSKKFRDRFLRYVKAQPTALMEFQKFYRKTN